MKRELPLNQIINGECLEVMKTFPDKSVDLVLTDPPFEKEAHTLQRRVKREGGIMEIEALDFDAITEEVRLEASKQFARLAKGWVLVFCQIEASHKWIKAMEEAGLVYRRTCIWVKPDGMPQYSGDRPGMGYETIVAMHIPGKSKWNGGGRHGVFIVNKNDHGGKKAPHPTTKPRELMKKLVGLFSNENDIILDPFGGSCTTAVACKQLKRNYICIEKEAKYVAICHERLAQDLLF
jgi:DNA modification methylase